MKKIVLSSAILLFASAFSYFGMPSKAGPCPSKGVKDGYCVPVYGSNPGEILYYVCVPPETMAPDCTLGGTRVIGLEF